MGYSPSPQPAQWAWHPELTQLHCEFPWRKKTKNREINALVKASKDLHCSNLTLLSLSDDNTHLVNDVKVDEKNIINWLLTNINNF